MCVAQGGNHFDQYEDGQVELEQASLDKPIEPVRPHPVVPHHWTSCESGWLVQAGILLFCVNVKRPLDSP